LLKPKIIVCLGEVPTYQILGLNESIKKLRGKWQTLKSYGLNYEFSVLPTFNVSHLLNRPDLKRYAWEDMKLLRDKIKEI
jgi:DNA polymerase